jgi:hypothetical protein
MSIDGRHQHGGALLPVMLIMFLFSAIALGTSMVVRTETIVSARFRRAAEALYAADAGIAVALTELRPLPVWTPVLNGGIASAFSQGAFQGTLTVPGGGTILLCCGPGSVSDRVLMESRLSAIPARRAVEWQPFLWSPLDPIVRTAMPSRFVLVVFVADDDDGDGDRRSDANGVVILRSQAVEADGTQRAVEALVARREPDSESGSPAVAVLRWQEIR